MRRLVGGVAGGQLDVLSPRQRMPRLALHREERRLVRRAGSAAAAYSPSSRDEIASSVISGDLERDVGHGLDVVCVS